MQLRRDRLFSSLQSLGTLLALVLTAPLPVHVESFRTPQVPIPSSYFGMTFIDPNDANEFNAGTIGKGTFVSWIYIEHNKGTYDWRVLDKWVAKAQQLNADLLYTFGWFPEWAVKDRTACLPSAMPDVRRCASPLATIADFDKFVSALVVRYRARIKYYELWNEPEFMPGITPGQMVTLTKHAYNIIRATDPGAKIISPSFNAYRPAYGLEYCAFGGAGMQFDAVSFHSYPNINYNFAETVDVSYDGPYALFAPLRAVFEACHFGAIPIWDSEGSWTADKQARMTDSEKEAFISKSLLLHWANGVTRFYWYAWDHDYIGRLKGAPASIAYLQTRRWMQGAVMDRRCAQHSDSSPLWLCGLSRSGSYHALAVWNASGEFAFPVPAGYTRYRDLMGGSHLIVSPTVMVGPKPILLESRDTTFDFNP
jgi:hypothetical protein